MSQRVLVSQELVANYSGRHGKDGYPGQNGYNGPFPGGNGGDGTEGGYAMRGENAEHISLLLQSDFN